MSVIKINGDPPLERSARHAQILQSRKQEIVHHLVLARYGPDKLGMPVDMVDQPVRVLAHPEEVRLLLRRLYLAPAVRALAVL